jgi:hypothetical protein
MKKQEREAVSRLMNEYVLCGGLLYTRKQLFDELLAEGHPERYVDAFVFGYLQRVEVTPQLVEQDAVIRAAIRKEEIEQ